MLSLPVDSAVPMALMNDLGTPSACTSRRRRPSRSNRSVTSAITSGSGLPRKPAGLTVREVFSPAVRRHTSSPRAGPADRGGRLPGAAGARTPRRSTSDSRRHLRGVERCRIDRGCPQACGALTARGLARGDRVVMVADNTEGIPRDPARRTAARRGSPVRSLATRPAARGIGGRATSSGRDRRHRSTLRWWLARTVAPRAHPHGALQGPRGRRAAPFRTLSRPAPADVHHLQLTPRVRRPPQGGRAHPRQRRPQHRHRQPGDGHGPRQWGSFSWLPMYHDMGLIQVLGALICSGRIGLMTPLGFLRDLFSWMRNMTHHRSTVTAGPVRLPRRRRCAGAGGTPPSDVDLSELRHAYREG